jgi:hypothetical protein
MQLSDMPKKNLANSPNFFFIKTCNIEMTSYAMQDQT